MYSKNENGIEINSDTAMLTVIVVIYNHIDSIEKALDSVLIQETTYPYEVWLCDDHSTDGTTIICTEYAKRYPDKVKLFIQAENTYSNPRKEFHLITALRRVNTKYYCILEGDDNWCDSKKIQIALDTLEANPKYVTFAHDTLFNDFEKKTQKSLVSDSLSIKIQNPVYFENAPYLHSSSRVYRNVIEFPKDFKIYEDICLFYLYLDAGPLYYFDKVMSVYNLTGKGLWTSASQTEKDRWFVFLSYSLNKYLKLKYNNFFSNTIENFINRGGDVKSLKLFRTVFGKWLGGELWYWSQYFNTYILPVIRAYIKLIFRGNLTPG